MNDYYLIKDRCREGLVRHLEKACSKIPEIDNPGILDIGCGTGVPTMWLAGNFSGSVTAIDIDKDALEFLEKKIHSKHLQNRVKTINISFFDFTSVPGDPFDMILAEGFLNVVGFETGFKSLLEILKRQGYFIVHDGYRDHDQKCDFIQDNNCRIIDTLYLDETVWWNDYYRQLETEINQLKNVGIRDLFTSDMKEIETFKTDPYSFRSMYYIVQKLHI
jgi:cyclopropane fatty-acyl-phospholipid synthase-like methyltransferase